MEKELANQHFLDGNYLMAVKTYSELLTSNPLDCSILSNRSAAYIKMEQYNLALEDAVKVTKLRPDWGKAWGRLGAALYGLNKLSDSLVAYNKANELEPSFIYTNMITEINNQLNVLPNSLDMDDDLMDQFQNLDMDGNLVEQFKNLGNNSLGNLFNNLCNSVFANPNLLEKLNNQDFQNKVLSLQSNPFEAIKDPEILGIMGEMMKGVKL